MIVGAASVRRLSVAAGLLFIGWANAACDTVDREPAPPTGDDAGVVVSDCEVGTQGCACTLSGGCREGLLCVAFSCLPVQGTDEGPMVPTTPTRPTSPVTTPPPEPENPDSGLQDAGSGDAGLGDAGLDAGPLDAG